MPRLAMPEHLPAGPDAQRGGPAVLNVQRMLSAGSPAVVDGCNAMLGGFYRPDAALPADLREVAILRVGALSACEYEVMQHRPLAQLVGFSAAQVDAIVAGSDAGLSPAQDSVRRFADDVIRNVRAGAALVEELRTHLPDRAIVDLILCIGAYMAVARLLETADVPHDPPLDWTLLPG